MIDGIIIDIWRSAYGVITDIDFEDLNRSDPYPDYIRSEGAVIYRKKPNERILYHYGRNDLPD